MDTSPRVTRSVSPSEIDSTVTTSPSTSAGAAGAAGSALREPSAVRDSSAAREARDCAASIEDDAAARELCAAEDEAASDDAAARLVAAASTEGVGVVGIVLTDAEVSASLAGVTPSSVAVQPVSRSRDSAAAGSAARRRARGTRILEWVGRGTTKAPP